MATPICPDYGTNFLLPPSLEDWVPKDHPARFLREFVDALDLPTLGFAMPQANEGRPPYAPSLLLKIWLYGYLHRIRATRKLEVACANELPLVWLCGMLRPDHNSLWRFWTENKKALRALFKQTVHIAMGAGLVGLALQALDGTKIQAVASGQTSWTKEHMEKLLAALDATLDQTEEQIAQGGPVPAEQTYRLPEAAQDRQHLRQVIQDGLAQLHQTQREHYHRHEPEARRMQCEGRNRFAYNAQAVSDSQERILTAAEVTNAEADQGQLVPMLQQAQANTGSLAQENAADTGYGNGADLQAAQAAGLSVVTPLREGSNKAQDNPYHAHHFVYDPQRQSVTCPRGQALEYVSTKKTKGQDVRAYRCRCPDCPARAQCTSDPKGRGIEIWPHTAVVQAQKAKLQQPQAQGALRQRGRTIEWIFAVVKEQFGFRRWTVRGLEKVQAQWALLCTVLNLRTLWRHWKAGQLRLKPA